MIFYLMCISASLTETARYLYSEQRNRKDASIFVFLILSCG